MAFIQKLYASDTQSSRINFVDAESALCRCASIKRLRPHAPLPNIVGKLRGFPRFANLCSPVCHDLIAKVAHPASVSILLLRFAKATLLSFRLYSTFLVDD